MKKCAAVLLLFVFFAGKAGADEMQDIQVREGDTLWGIANKYLQDPSRWPEILKHNRLPMNDPNVALPGMKIKVPVVMIKERLRMASLVYLINDVLYRRKELPDWKNAKLNMALFNEDGIRTMDEGEAHVRFFSGDLLKIAKKSFVILRPELKREEVNLMAGVVRTGRTRILTPTAEVNPKSTDTLFKARVRKDQSTIVQVEKGSTEVLGIDTGKSVVVGEGFANITFAGTEPSPPVKVPTLPGYDIVDFNSRGEVVIAQASGEDKSGQPQKAASKGGAGAPGSESDRVRRDLSKNSYRVQLSLESQFKRIALDQVRPLSEKVDVATEKDYKVPDGKYYRRVSYTDNKGVPSAFYTLPMVEIDTLAPRLEIARPDNNFRTRQTLVNVEGVVDLGSIVTVNGHPVEVAPDGKFRWPLLINKAGENKIRIVAKDLSDNQTVVERVVYLVGAGD